MTVTDQQPWGPTMTGGRHTAVRLARRLVLPGLAGLVVLALLGLAAIGFWATGRIDRVDVGGLSPQQGQLNLLVVGSDSREGLSEEDQLELTTGFVEGQRTDTIFVLSVSGSKAAILALPRDLWVTRCDGSNGRINAAFQIAGPGCLVDTVERLTGLPVNHFVSVDFLGFRDVVDAVGGVELCLEQPIKDPYAGVDLPAGCQTLTGSQALGYVRVRKIDNDLERIKRQQRFLAALADKILATGTVVNPLRLADVSGAVGEALTADTGLGLTDLLRLARGARGLTTGAFAATTVPVRGATIGGAAVLLPIDDQAEALFSSFRDGSIFTTISPAEPAPTETPQDG